LPHNRLLARLVMVATLGATVAFPTFLAFGLLLLAEGKVLLAIGLFVCTAVGVPSFIRWRRRWRDRLG